MTEPLDEFLAPFYGKDTTPGAVTELLVWCNSDDGQTHDAPPPGAARSAAMLADFSVWIIDTLHRPPGWIAHTAAPTVDTAETWNAWRTALRQDFEHRTAAPDGYYSDELRDWARAWTAANPS